LFAGAKRKLILSDQHGGRGEQEIAAIDFHGETLTHPVGGFKNLPSVFGDFPFVLFSIEVCGFEKRKKTLAGSAPLRVKLLARIGRVPAKEQSTQRKSRDCGSNYGRDESRRTKALRAQRGI
jgi:hypothetical protein